MYNSRENNKKPNFGPDFGMFGPNLGFPIFFPSSTSFASLYQAAILCNLKEN